MSILRFESESDLQRVVSRRVRGAASADLAPGAAPRVSSAASGAAEAGSAAGGNDAAALNEVTFPWPPKELSPNARVHWAVKSKAAKAYRAEGAWLTHAAGLVVGWHGLVHVWITFYPPSRRHYDDDNLVAAFKACRDGMADALSINDKRIRIHPWLSDEVVKGGSVVVRLSMEPQE